MKVTELQARQGNVSIALTIKEKGNIRQFDRFGNVGRVCTAIAFDETGTIQLTLWNDQIDLVKDGCKVMVKNGYVGEWQGELQLSTGKFGKLEILES